MIARLMIARLSLMRSQSGANGLFIGLVSLCAAALFAQSSVIVAAETKADDVLRASHLAAGFAVVTPAGDGTLALGLASQPGRGLDSTLWAGPGVVMQFAHFPRALHDPRVAELLLDGLFYAGGTSNVEAPDAQSKIQ